LINRDYQSIHLHFNQAKFDDSSALSGGRQTPYAWEVPRSSPDRFDAGFYRRFYLDPRTRVVTRAEMTRRADLIAAFVRHADLPIRRILDVGCGLGLMRARLLRHFPRATYTGLEASAYLCERHGWVQGSAATFESARPFDLVVCHDVLQYLGAREADAALRNLARLCRGVLHFGVLTTQDWHLYCDQRDTDRDVHLRSGAWYRRRLAPSFVNAGSGMFVRRGAPFHLWELDQLDAPRRAARTA
jgi:SAM-dependent methyltransferase